MQRPAMIRQPGGDGGCRLQTLMHGTEVVDATQQPHCGLDGLGRACEGTGTPLALTEGEAVTVELDAEQGRIVIAPETPPTDDTDDGDTELAELHQPGAPVSELGRQLRALRAKIVASGAPLLDWDELEQEVAARRGERH